MALSLPLAAALVVPAAAAANTDAASAPYCGITWGSLAKSSGTYSSAPLIATRTGKHACFDRLVFELNGPADGYRVGYTSEVYAASRQPMSAHTAGGALIGVRVLVPDVDQAAHQTYPYAEFDHVANLAGYQTLRDVVYGGNGYDHAAGRNYSIFAVGTRARLPFRVFVLAGPGSHSRIVLDVAHHW